MRLESGVPAAEGGSRQARLMLGPIREDIRQTLRVAWLDPGLEAAAQEPVFFAAAWSAIRPSVGRSFLALAKRLRDQAAGRADAFGPADLKERLGDVLTGEELVRVGEASRAMHLAASKSQIVVHLLLRAARRERTRGTGQEEPPARRGVPEWQRWMSALPTPESAKAVLARATQRFGTTEAPASLRPFARWPSSLEALWEELDPIVGSPDWRRAAGALRRSLLGGLDALPHGVDVQWAALLERGFGESDRRRVVDILEAHDAPAAGQTLVAGFAWQAFGAGDLGQEA